MRTFRITVETADPLGKHFEAVEILVGTVPTFTKAPRDLLERLGVPVESTYTTELADANHVERIRGRTVIRLQRKEFPTPVTFGDSSEAQIGGDGGDARAYSLRKSHNSLETKCISI